MTESQRAQVMSTAKGSESLAALRAETSNWPPEWFDYAKGLARWRNPSAVIHFEALREERMASLNQLETLSLAKKICVLAVAGIIVAALAVLLF